MNYSIIFMLNTFHLLSLSNTTMTSPLALGHFDGNSLETYEEMSNEQSDVDVFGNLTFYFTCEGRPSGFYADVDYNCRIFHVCGNFGDGFPVICANDTVFDQKRRICTDEEYNDCQHAHEWYYLNELSYPMEIAIDKESEMIEEDTMSSALPLVD